MRKLRFFGFLVLFVAAAVGATTLAGQSLTTTAVSGKVDNEGAGLPGVTVTLASPSLQGTRTATTSGAGEYTFVGIPPGNYTITFVLQGFKTVTKDGVQLSVGQRNVLNATLSLNEIAATATVSAKAEIVSTTTQASTTITSDLANKLPFARTIAQEAALSSGLNTVTSLNAANPPVTVSGAPTFDNLYTVDGAVITDNIRATPNQLYIEDAIMESQTSVNSVSAEYGRFQGGVINTVTKTGGNVFSGSFRTSFTNDAWSAISPAGEKRKQDLLERYEATLGGPIWKDHVWFFGAFRKASTSTAFLTNSITNIPFSQGDDEKRYQGKLTLTPFANHSFTGAYLKINEKQTNNVYPDAAHVLDTASFVNRTLPQDTLSLNYNGVLSSEFFVEGLYSNRHFTFENSGSLYTDLIQGTLMRDRAAGNIRYNAPTFCGVCGPEKRDNRDYLVKGTYFLSTGALGSHSIVVGYDNFAGQRSANNYQSGSNYRLFTTNIIVQGGDIFPVIGANSYIYYTPIFSLTHGTNTLTHSAFVNDSWRLSDRLSFNLGVRYDKNNATNSNEVTTANDSAFSPRLAASFDVTGKGNVRVGASYAHYVGGLQDAIQDSASSGGQPATFYWYYTGAGATPINCIPNGTGCTLPPAGTTLETRAQALQQVFNWFFAQGCPDLSTCKLPLSYASVPGLNRVITQTLKSPYAREYTFGVNGSLGLNKGSSFAYRADFVRRDFHDFYNLVINQQTGLVHDVTGKAYDLGVIGNTNDVQRNYTGLQTQFQYRYNWLTLGANWTWSHTLGNFDGENSTSGPLTNALDSYPEYKQASWNQPYGSMFTDQRHRVRVLGFADLGFIPPKLGTVSFGLIQSYDTGAPYGAAGLVASRLYVTNPGYATRPSSVTYYYTPRDAFRTANISRTDLSLNYQIKIGGLVEIFVQPQVLNVFNNRGLIGVDTTVQTSVSPGTGNTYLPFNPFTTTPVQRPHGDTAVKTANWDYGPNFGKARSNADYQLPRTFTLTAGLRF